MANLKHTSDEIGRTYEKAVEVLRACSRKQGFFASGLPGGYEAVWARDSMITSLGASLAKSEFRTTFRKSIELLFDNQAEMGQIPNCVGSWNEDRQSDVTFNSIDAPLWLIIGTYAYSKRFNDKAVITKYAKQIQRAFSWLRAQDPDNIGLIAQQPTNDWQDAFPHKYGYVLHDLALYYAVLKMLGEHHLAEILRSVVNGDSRKYSSLYDQRLGYYYPWGWKNHDRIREHEEWFDTAGNLIAIITGLADQRTSARILDFIEKNRINRPFPCKCIWPPIKPGDKEWHDYFELCDARQPLKYLNAGIWPFIGGLYVAALVKVGQNEKARQELLLLAEANLQVIKNPGHPQYMLELSKARHMDLGELKILRQKEFNEWLDGKTGKPKGEPYQGWSAGMYIYAYECVKKRRAIYF